MDSLQQRREIFLKQVLRLGHFGLNYSRQYKDNFPAMEKQRDNLLQTMIACARYARAWDLALEMATLLDSYMMKLGLWQSWANYLERLVEAVNGRADSHITATVLNKLGNAYCGSGEWDKALRAQAKAVQEFKKTGDDDGLAQALFDLGRIYWFLGKWEEALYFYKQAARLVEKLKDEDKLARLLNTIGLVYWRKGEWRRALAYYERSLELTSRIGEERRLARIYNHMALAYSDLEEWDKAQKCYELALEISERVKDKTGLAYTYGDMSSFYLRQGNWRRARECLERAQVLWQETEDQAGLADHYKHQGLFHATLGEYRQALECYARSIEMWEQMGNEQNLVTLLGYVARIHYARKAFEEMDATIRRARQLAHRLKRRDVLASLYALEGEAHFETGQPLKGLWSYLLGIVTALSWTNDALIRLRRKMLARLCERLRGRKTSGQGHHVADTW